ncbi:MAG: TfoX/Sxy family protein [Exiguobacterium profundum]|nr:MAG: TfoX/Sxy family protein [Exiguobacterium profundum]
MPWDEGLAQLMRDDLAPHPVTEKKMFGGLAFLLNGHMVCGIHKGGAMFRVGKPNEAAALAVPGASPMMFTGRPMSGMVDCSDEACADDARRGWLMALSLSFVQALPPK